jgi:hypothetical protein
VGGFDQNYTYHHFYDKDISVTSYKNGWHNIMVGVYCHHISGRTANQSEYAEWIAKKMRAEIGNGDNASFQESGHYFIRKFYGWLPRMIGQGR